MTLTELAQWLRSRELALKPPPGQTNEISDNLGETAAFIEAYIDLGNGITRKLKLVAAVKVHNDDLVSTCAERRVHPTTPCGGKVGVRCPDCPRTLGLTAGNRTIPG